MDKELKYKAEIAELKATIERLSSNNTIDSKSDQLASLARLTLNENQVNLLSSQPILFNGKNYYDWCKSVKNYLTMSNETSYLTKEIKQNTLTDEKQTSKNVALKLFRYMNDEIRGMFESEGAFAYDVWNDLKDVYGAQEDMAKFNMITKMFTIKISNFETREEYLSAFLTNILQMDKIGISIPDEIKLGFLVNSLEDKYKDLVKQAPTLSYAEFLKKLKILVLNPSTTQNTHSFMNKKFVNNKKQQFYYKNQNDKQSPQQYKKQFNNFKNQLQHNYNHKDYNKSNYKNNNYKSKPHNKKSSYRDNKNNRKHNYYSNENENSGNESQEEQQTEKREYNNYNKSFNSSINTIRNDIFICDSGTSRSICKNKKYFTEIRYFKDNESKNKMIFGCGTLTSAVGVGKIRLKTKSGITLNINDVLYMPNYEANLIKMPKNKDFKIIPDDNDLVLIDKISNERTIIGHRRTKIDDLYQFDLINDNKTDKCFLNVSDKFNNLNDYEKNVYLHNLYGHPSEKIMRNITKEYNVNFIKTNCDTCKASNLVRNIPKHRNNNSKYPFESLHIDLGISKIKSNDDYKYFLVIVDEFSQFKTVICLKNKSEVADEFEIWYAQMSTLTNNKCKYITTDNGTEFVNEKFKSFLKKEKIIHKKTVPYHSFQNGIAERSIRTIRLIANKLLNSSNIKINFWSYAVRYAVFIHNRRPNIKNDYVPPIKILAPNLIEDRKLLEFGSPIYFINPSESKSDSNKRPGVFLTYPGFVKGYIVYDLIDQKTKMVHDLIETDSFLSKDINNNLLSIYNNMNRFFNQTDLTKVQVNSNKLKIENSIQQEDNYENNLIEYNPQIFDEYEPEEVINLENLNEKLFPIDIENLSNKNEKQQWLDASKEEFMALVNSGTITYVNRPKNKKILSSFLLTTEKLDANNRPYRKKVRIVANGKQQPKLGKRRTYAPVAGKPIIRLILGIANQFKMNIHNVDIKNAFLNSPIDEEVYVLPPPMFRKKDLVWKIHKAIYGLKQSAKLWFKCLSSFIIKYGLKQSIREPCLFYNKDLIVIIYVDDLIICSSNLELIDKFKKGISKAFIIRDLGELKEILGIKIEYDKKAGIMNLSQPGKIEGIIKDFEDQIKLNYTNCPIPKGTDIVGASKSGNMLNEEQSFIYRSLVMRLNYLAMTTRPDLAIYVNILSRYNQEPTVELMKNAIKIVSYLTQTKDLVLQFTRLDKINFCLYSDSSFKIANGESTIGLVAMFNGTAFDWSCFKNKNVCTSINESEFTSIYQSSKSVVYYRDIFEFLHIKIDRPTLIFNDNKGAVDCAVNSIKFDSRDFDSKQLKVIERVRDGLINVIEINEGDNVADIFTKFLDYTRFRNNVYGLGLVGYDQSLLKVRKRAVK